MSEPSYILALDQGTTSSRAMVFDRRGNICAAAQQPFEQHFPQDGWVEHDAREIWATQLACAQRALKLAEVTAAQVAAIGITNQRETTVLWNRRTGEPLARAIVWQDRRTAARCDELRAQGHASLIQRKTGLVLDSYFSGTKLAWLLDNVPGARAQAERGELAFGTVDSWLVWHLSGGATHITDPSNASRTMLYNIYTQAWDDELLALLKIPREVLPQVHASSGVVAHTRAALLGEPIAIAGIAGDQQAATFGQACIKPGMAKNTYGTGCFLMLNTGERAMHSQNRLLSTIGWQINGNASTYMLEGSVFMGGATVQWLRDGLGIIASSEDIETLAASAPDSEGVVLVPGFTGLGAPHWDAYARGSLLGMTRGTTRAHIARAALEAIALQSADVLDAMQRDAGITLAELRVDGGAARNNLLMQLQADILGTRVVRPRVTETTALGAAYLAGVAVGYWQGVEEVASQWAAERVFEPQATDAWRAELRQRWQRGIERAKGWAQ
jgi:glycerol kinase